MCRITIVFCYYSDLKIKVHESSILVIYLIYGEVVSLCHLPVLMAIVPTSTCCPHADLLKCSFLVFQFFFLIVLIACLCVCPVLQHQQQTAAAWSRIWGAGVRHETFWGAGEHLLSFLGSLFPPIKTGYRILCCIQTWHWDQKLLFYPLNIFQTG